MDTILLTGGTGFLGSNLLLKLVADGYNIILLKRSFSNTIRINNLLPSVISYDIDKINIVDIFKKHKINIIIHAATDYGRKNIISSEVVTANLIFPLELLLCGMKSGDLKAFINTDTVIDKRINQYSLSKYQFSEWLKFYSKDLRCINISLEHFYGFNDDKTKFISSVINKILKEEHSIDFTPGEQKRDFIHINDVISGFITILNKLDKISLGYNNYNLGTGKNITIKKCVEFIKKAAHNNKTKLNFGALAYRENELMQSSSDINGLLALGWKPKISFEEGITSTINMERLFGL